jgi:hypothetical protein
VSSIVTAAFLHAARQHREALLKAGNESHERDLGTIQLREAQLLRVTLRRIAEADVLGRRLSRQCLYTFGSRLGAATRPGVHLPRQGRPGDAPRTHPHEATKDQSQQSIRR